MNLNEAQLDFILENYAIENPKTATFHRPGKAIEFTQAERNAALERVLTGRDRSVMLQGQMPPEAVLEKIRQMGRYLNPQIKKPRAGNNDHRK